MTHNITEPLQLAKGSHKAGSGRGCAMNVISWENGDVEITDYPLCSDPFLATLVQIMNDSVADPVTGLLSPENSMRVLDLGHQTVGTTSHRLSFYGTVRLYDTLIRKYVGEGDPHYLRSMRDVLDGHSYISGYNSWVSFREAGLLAAKFVMSAVRNRVDRPYRILDGSFTQYHLSGSFVDEFEKEVKEIFAEFKHFTRVKTKEIPAEVTQEAVSKMLACTV